MRRFAAFVIVCAIAGTCAPPAHAGTTALAAPVVAAPPGAGLAAGTADSLRALFEAPAQTIEYHYMLELPRVPEDSLAGAFAARVAGPLHAIANVGPLGECEPCAYVDSRQRGLARQDLIVRVRDGHVTVKARAVSPDRLLDLPACTARKYEMDYFGEPEYSISTDLKVRHRDGGVRPATGDAAPVWALIERACPELWRRVSPAVAGAGACEVPGIAHTYTAEVSLRWQGAPALKESGLTVWYFPPTGAMLAELSFTGFVRDRTALDRMYNDLRASLASASLLRKDQSSKTRQYFDAALEAYDISEVR